MTKKKKSKMNHSSKDNIKKTSYNSYNEDMANYSNNMNDDNLNKSN